MFHTVPGLAYYPGVGAFRRVVVYLPGSEVGYDLLPISYREYLEARARQEEKSEFVGMPMYLAEGEGGLFLYPTPDRVYEIQVREP